jgi:hypothetical protein
MSCPEDLPLVCRAAFAIFANFDDFNMFGSGRTSAATLTLILDMILAAGAATGMAGWLRT